MFSHIPTQSLDSRCLPQNRPFWAVKHWYMFVIDAGVVVLYKYGIEGTLQCKVITHIPGSLTNTFPLPTGLWLWPYTVLLYWTTMINIILINIIPTTKTHKSGNGVPHCYQYINVSKTFAFFDLKKSNSNGYNIYKNAKGSMLWKKVVVFANALITQL